jgi:hypothetical protein
VFAKNSLWDEGFDSGGLMEFSLVDNGLGLFNLATCNILAKSGEYLFLEPFSGLGLTFSDLVGFDTFLEKFSNEGLVGRFRDKGDDTRGLEIVAMLGPALVSKLIPYPPSKLILPKKTRNVNLSSFFLAS